MNKSFPFFKGRKQILDFPRRTCIAESLNPNLSFFGFPYLLSRQWINYQWGREFSEQVEEIIY